MREGNKWCQILAIGPVKSTKHEHVWPTETLPRSSYHLAHLLQAEQQAREQDGSIQELNDHSYWPTVGT